MTLEDIHNRLESRLQSKPVSEEEKIRRRILEQSRQERIKLNARRNAMRAEADELLERNTHPVQPEPQQVSFADHLYRTSRKVEEYYNGF